MDSRTAQALSTLSESINELLQFKAYTQAKLTSLTKELAEIKLKYANIRSPAVFELNDYEQELRKVEKKIKDMQTEVSQLTTDLVDFTDQLSEES